MEEKNCENIRAYILSTANDIVNGMRNDEYGTPEDNFGYIARLWDIYLEKALGRTGPIPLSSTDVAAMMILLKIARMRLNSSNTDNWIDIAGYAACGAECAPIFWGTAESGIEEK